MNRLPLRVRAILLLGLALAAPAPAAKVTLRLVRADAPGERVSTAITRIDVTAERERAEAERELAALRGGSKGAPAPPPQEELKPRAEFDRYSNYMRGIVIDSRHPFQRMYEGSYLGRSDEITVELADGEHRIDPGAHVFTVAGKQLATSDPTLAVRDGVLEVTLYPLTIIAMDGSAVRQMPAEVLRLPVSPRLHWNGESILPKEEQVAASATFKRMTLYVTANTEGLGYRVSPSERSFHVTPEGVVLLDPEGKPATDRGVYIEGRYTIVLPKMSVPVLMKGRGMTVTIAGPAGTFSGATETKDTFTGRFTGFSAPGGAAIRFGRRAENGPFTFQGDFGAYPRRQLLFDAADADDAEPRMLSVALPSGSVRAGATLQARIEAVDAIGAATIAPFQPRALLLKTPILREDGSLLSSPDATTPAADWRELAVRSTDQSDVYAIELPADLPSSVYFLRLGADRRGSATPLPALHVDFAQGIVNPAAAATLSVFCRDGRHAFLRGAEIPFSAVIKTTAPVAAGTLQLVLVSERGRFILHEQAVPALAPGQHPFHFVLGGVATEALRPGAYKLSAVLGTLAGNEWPLIVAEPRNRAGAPHFDEAWLGPNFDVGSEYINLPENLRELNDKRARLMRQAGIRAQRTDLQMVDWSSTAGGHANYQGRDNSSEAAQVQALLRADLALPAEEIYYTQNNFELVNEALATYGLDHYNSTPCFITPLSLIHSIPDQVNAKMRQYQLIAQIGRKFDNFTGLSLMFMSTSPLGNSEIPDPTRHLRMLTMERNFEAAQGFPSPPILDATTYIRARLAGTPPPDADVGRRWEAYQVMINTLMANYHGTAREAVEPLVRRLAITNRGPSWGGDTGSGTYPELSNPNQEPLMVFTGHGDSAHDCIWEPYLKTMTFRMSGRECWGVEGSLRMAPLVKHNLGQYLMAGALGFGYLGGGKPEDGLTGRTQWARMAQDVLDANDFMRVYGPALRQVRHQGEVAIFYPFNQSTYDDVSLERLNSLHTLHAALMQLAMLGYSTEILTEKMLEAGELARFKAVVAPLLYYLRPAHLQALEAYTAGGGPLLVGSASRIVPKGALKIEDDFQEHTQARFMWSFQGPIDLAHAWMQSEMRRKAPILRQALEHVLRPFAAPRTDTLLLQTATAGVARYTFVCNFLYPSWMGTTRLTDVPQVSGLMGEANENTMVPQMAILDLPADTVTYDLFTQQRLGAATATAAQDGRIAVACDLSRGPFRLLVSLPAAIAALRVELPAEVLLGQAIPLRVHALDEAGQPLAAALPVEVSVRDAAGEALPPVQGATGMDLRLAASIGYRAGAWKVHVKDLVSGRRIEATLTVTDTGNLPPGSAPRLLPAVDVQNPELLRAFLAARRADGQPVRVLLDDSQQTQRAAVAAELAETLRALGLKAEVSSVNAPGVFAEGERMKSYGRFVEMAPSQFIDQHIALVGGEGECVLLEELQESRLFDRGLSASYPGPGRGALALVRSPFAYQKDVLCLLGPDNEGLRAAVAALRALPAASATPEAPASAAAALARVTTDQAGVAEPSADLAARDGAAILSLAASPAGDRIAFGTAGYARNLFVFDAAGQLVFEDAVGHIFASALSFVEGGRLAVTTENTTYLRAPDGTLSWRLGSRSPWRGSGATLDPGGRYVVYDRDGAFTVYDLNLAALWGFDEWGRYETTREILFGRKAEFLGSVDNGAAIVYRLAGKEPGAAGAFRDVLIFADALTGRAQATIDVATEALLDEAGRKARGKIKTVTPVEDGAAFLVAFSAYRQVLPDVLVDRNFKLLLRERYEAPDYFGGSTRRDGKQLAWERRQVFAVGNLLCLSNPEWTKLAVLPADRQILGLAVDRARRRLAIADFGGSLTVVDEHLRKLWDARLDGAARLLFLADGRLVAGTTRGTAACFAADGQRQWEQSLNRFAPPAEVERRWSEVEATRGLAAGMQEPWHARLTKQVDLGPEQAPLSGSAGAAAPQDAAFDGQPFGTYLVEWRHGQARGEVALGLTVDETEQPAADGSQPVLRRLSLSAQPRGAMAADYAILRLGDRPGRVAVAVRGSGDGEAASSVSMRQLLFPSPNLIRMDSLYRGLNQDALYVDPPARLGIFMNVAEEGAPHTALRVMPEALVNGRLMETEPELDKGLWWGGGAGAERGLGHAEIPTWVEITLPRKKVLSHIVIAEDPALARVESLTVDAYVESTEVRGEVAAFEKRAVAVGFWHNVVKVRNNTSPYNVYRFDKPVYTDKLRVYVLGGHSAITEIELYGAIPKVDER